MVFPCNSLVRNRWAPRNLCCHLGCLLEHSFRIVAVSSWAANLKHTVPSQRWGHADMPRPWGNDALLTNSQGKARGLHVCCWEPESDLNLICRPELPELRTDRIERPFVAPLAESENRCCQESESLEPCKFSQLFLFHQVERCRELTRCAVQVQAAASSQLAPCRLCKETN